MNETRAATTARALRRAVATRDVWIPVTGDSMGRTVRSGSSVRLAAAARPRRGEIWAFCTAGGKILVHRCRDERDGLFVFRGDRRLMDDTPVAAALLIGRVVEIERGGGRRRLRGNRRILGFAVQLTTRKRHKVTMRYGGDAP